MSLFWLLCSPVEMNADGWLCGENVTRHQQCQNVDGLMMRNMERGFHYKIHTIMYMWGCVMYVRMVKVDLRLKL